MQHKVVKILKKKRRQLPPFLKYYMKRLIKDVAQTQLQGPCS
jgi:hypothetical protein